MFKVSFKENPKFPVRKVQRIEHTRETVVTLRGAVSLPVFMQYYIPSKIWDWIESCKNVQAEITMTRMYLTVRGKARRAYDDADNPILGERIAECRAKINLYSFMYHLISELYVYYCRLLSSNTLTESGCKDNTVHGAMTKYANFCNREEAHLKALLAHESDTENNQKH